MPSHDRIPDRPVLDLPDVALSYANEEDRKLVNQRVAAVHKMHSDYPLLSPKQKRYDLLEAMGVFNRMGLAHPRDRAGEQGQGRA